MPNYTLRAAYSTARARELHRAALDAAEYWHAQYDALLAESAKLPPDPHLLRQMAAHTTLPERVTVPVRCEACGWETTDAELTPDAVRPFWQLAVDNLALLEMVRRLSAKWLRALMDRESLDQSVFSVVGPEMHRHIISGPHRPDEWQHREDESD